MLTGDPGDPCALCISLVMVRQVSHRLQLITDTRLADDNFFHKGEWYQTLSLCGSLEAWCAFTGCGLGWHCLDGTVSLEKMLRVD